MATKERGDRMTNEKTVTLNSNHYKDIEGSAPQNLQHSILSICQSLFSLLVDISKSGAQWGIRTQDLQLLEHDAKTITKLAIT